MNCHPLTQAISANQQNPREGRKILIGSLDQPIAQLMTPRLEQVRVPCGRQLRKRKSPCSPDRHTTHLAYRTPQLGRCIDTGVVRSLLRAGKLGGRTGYSHLLPGCPSSRLPAVRATSQSHHHVDGRRRARESIGRETTRRVAYINPAVPN